MHHPQVTMGEIETASQQGTLLEIFICGTGAIVCPVKVRISLSILFLNPS